MKFDWGNAAKGAVGGGLISGFNPIGLAGGALIGGFFGGQDRYGQRDAVQSTSFRNVAENQNQSAYNAPDFGPDERRSGVITDGNPSPGMMQPPPMPGMGGMGMGAPMNLGMSASMPMAPSTMPMMPRQQQGKIPPRGGQPGMPQQPGPVQPPLGMFNNSAGMLGVAKMPMGPPNGGFAPPQMGGMPGGPPQLGQTQGWIGDALRGYFGSYGPRSIPSREERGMMF